MKETFESTKKGLNEAIELSQGKVVKAKVNKINPQIDVKDIRKNIGITQRDFALSLGISLATLRHWERGDRIPKGPGLVLLHLVKKDPETIFKLLGATA
ncbi:MAG TPA: helix-turn-helix domain-containing protein [Candidatus Kapabacteria bacterium]|nr:helix-turn-helix domain-containing protein [Candidatus Kapabacteria bacterium]